MTHMQVNSAELMRQHRAHKERMARLGSVSRRKSWVPSRAPRAVEPALAPLPPVPVLHDHGFDLHVTAWRIASWPQADAQPAIAVRDIVAEVAAYYKIPLVDVLAHRRLKGLARARQVAMYLARTLTTKSMPTIGAAMGRDHTTVTHGVQKIEAAMVTDLRLAAEVEALRLLLVGGDPR